MPGPPPMDKHYNPLDRENLGKSIAQALLENECVPLASIKKLKGAGIYALYYSGDFFAYKNLVASIDLTDAGGLIYVGRAEPPGKRKGDAYGSEGDVKSLQGRLNNHRKSIEEAINIELDDFSCRYLLVEDIFIPLGESLLIADHKPLWNTIIDGFGNNAPGKGRDKQVQSRWDTLHPGRQWASKLPPREETAMQIANEVIAKTAS